MVEKDNNYINLSNVNRDLIIDSKSGEVEIALLEEKNLVELHKEKTNNSFAVGDIYLGKVKKVMTGLNAAFVNVGYEKDSFLHYLDLGPQVNSLIKFTKVATTGKGDLSTLSGFEPEPDIDKAGKISQVLTTGQSVLVQKSRQFSSLVTSVLYHAPIIGRHDNTDGAPHANRIRHAHGRDEALVDPGTAQDD